MKQVFLLLLALLMLISGCREKRDKQEISDALNIDISAGEITDVWDTHGGFHGDGFTVVTVKDREGVICGEILAAGGWRSLPLSESVKTLLYGMAGEGPHEGRTSGDALPIPFTENGFWFFRDRHSACTDPADDSVIFTRPSINCTVAVYDRDTGTLYYMEYDT